MKNTVKFIFISIFGCLIFILPFDFLNPNTSESVKTIFLGHFKNYAFYYMGKEILYFTIFIMFLTLIGTIIGLFYTFKNKFLSLMFNSDLFQCFLKIMGSSLYLFYVFGGKLVINGIDLFENTASVMSVTLKSDDFSSGLIQPLYVTFFVGIMLMPLLTKFGFVEFLGTLVSPFMKKIFKVPGFAAVDAIASFVGDGTIGIVVTDQQYQNGYYTQKQAAIVASTFSIVGISFAVLVAEMLGFSSIFGLFYFSIFFVTIIIAFITARMPLKKFSDNYYNEDHIVTIEDINDSLFKTAISSATKKASETKILNVVYESLVHVLLIYITFIPIIMIVGTIGLIIAEHTYIFSVISYPIYIFLNLIGFNSNVSAQMAPAMIVGFADMYLPAIFIENSESILAKFVVGVLSFTQLIFLSETGMILLKSKIGFNFFDLVKIFLFRSLISFPIVLFIGILLQTLNII